jgi:hypothetical protein
MTDDTMLERLYDRFNARDSPRPHLNVVGDTLGLLRFAKEKQRG